MSPTILLVSFGRISDTYDLGVFVFAIGSLLLFLTPHIGTTGEWERIIYRFVQGIGGAFPIASPS